MKRSSLALLALLLSAPASGVSHYRYVHQPDADFYFGHISYCELGDDALDPRVARAEGVEAASVNLPLAPGDTILTTTGRRCEAQFDTGTILRLDGASELRIETVLARSLTSSDKLTNLVLGRGRLYAMYRDYDGDEVFQVLTPNAAVKLTRSAVIDIAWSEQTGTRIHLARGSAAVLYGPNAERTLRRKLKAGERLVVGADHVAVAPAPAAGEPADEFADWNRTLNERFVDLHSGKSELPKPVYLFPPAVVHFAERWSSASGEWVWSRLYGYAWRPYLSRDEGWRPYLQGRWTPIGSHLFWVPQEPWGWVPYHLGLWHWEKKNGWVWIPGSAFAPAWVSFASCDEGYAWRPLGLWDWYRDRSRPPGLLGWSGSLAWYDSFGSLCGSLMPWPLRLATARQAAAEYATTTPPTPVPIPQPSPAPGPAPSPLPSREYPRPRILLPAELRAASERAWKALERGDPEVREALGGGRGVVEGPVERRLDRRREVEAPPPAGHGWAGPSPTIATIEAPKPATSIAHLPPAHGETAGRAPDQTRDRMLRAAAEAGGAIARSAGQAHSAGAPAAPDPARFRDWNPDVRAARGVGGRIVYRSEANAVRCEDCRRPLLRPVWTERGSGGSSAFASSGASSEWGGSAAGAGAAAGPAGDRGPADRGDTKTKEK